MPPSLRKLTDSWYPGYHGTLGTGAFTLIDPVSWHGVRPATSGTDKLNKAFTLIELLIVITILAILGSAISIVLNPAELLAEARDSQRINDLESLRNSLSLTLIDNPSLFGSLSNTSIYLSLPSSSCLTNPPSGYTYICNAASLNLQKTDSSGWLPLSLTNLPVFPIDPVNSSSSSLYYAFVPDLTNHTFVLTSLLESEKYLKLSALKDGGTDPGRIEEGNPALWTSASGLVGYWPMDEGTGTTAQDLSGNNNTGTLTNGPTWSAGSIGNGISFDGSLSYVNAGAISQFNSATAISVLAFVKSNSLGAQQMIMQRGSSYHVNGYFWMHLDSAGRPTIDIEDNTTFAHIVRSSTTPVSAGAWSMAAFTVNQGSINVYTNDKASTFSFNGLYPLVSGANNYYQRLNIGTWTYNADTPTTTFNGVIDEVRIYKRALSAKEIESIYNALK